MCQYYRDKRSLGWKYLGSEAPSQRLDTDQCQDECYRGYQKRHEDIRTGVGKDIVVITTRDESKGKKFEVTLCFPSVHCETFLVTS